MIPGIDVSSYQRSRYPTHGLTFVAIKATEGTRYVNPHLRGQLATAREAGLAVVFYHFLHPGDVEEQVLHFLDTAPEDGRDGLAIDWETNPDGRAPSCPEKDTALRAVKRHDPHHKALLYCNRDFWLHHDTTSYCADGLWIADPGAAAGHPRIEHPWTIHQYEISGGVDRDVANFTTKNAMRSWLHA